MKMQFAKKLLAGFAAAALLAGALAGCSNGSEADGGFGGAIGDGPSRDSAMEYGRYVEQNITPPDFSGDINGVATYGNVIDLVAYQFEYDEANGEVLNDEYRRYRSEDKGETWQVTTLDFGDEYDTDLDYMDLPEEFTTLGHYMCVMEGGDILTTINTYDSNYNVKDTQFLRVSQDGERTTVEIPAIRQALDNGDEIMVDTIRALGGNRVYIGVLVSQDGMGYSSDGGINAVYDAETFEQLYTLDWEGWNIMFNAENIYLFGYDNSIQAIDIATGQPADARLPDTEALYSMNSNFGMYDTGTYIDESNTVYTLDSRGVRSLSAEMEEAETVMKAENYTFGSPLIRTSYFGMLEGGEFLVALGENYTVDTLLRYYWDPEAPASSDTLLRVYSVYESNTLRLAINEFKKQHPEYEVEYEVSFLRDTWGGVAVQDSEVLTVDDALRGLSTRLLAGNGPDVLILDDLPLESYIDQGVLEDISDLMAETDILPNLLEPLKRDGKLYAVPGAFAVPMVFGEVGSLDEANSLEAILGLVQADESPVSFAEPDYETATEEELNAFYDIYNMQVAAEDRPVMAFSSVDEVVDMLYKTTSPSVYSPGEGLNAEGMAQLLEAAKTISDHYGLRGLAYESTNFSNSSVSDGVVTYSIPSLLNYYSQQKTRYGYGMINTFRILQDVQNSAYWNRYSWEGDEQVEIEDYVYAKPEGEALAGFAGNVYYPQVVAGICTTSREKEAAQDFIACLLGEGVQGKDLADGFPVSRSAFMQQYTDFAEMESFYREEGMDPLTLDAEALLATLEVPAWPNETLQATINAQAKQYCAGETTLDAAVSAIMSESELYFAERQ